jgi:hypothetical protein
MPLKESWEALVELASALGLELGYAGIFPLQRDAARSNPAFAELAHPPAAEPEPAAVLTGPAHP